ncbi:MAG: S-layer homology domain-containing protein [Syntrophomonas sp.]|nr:S-layer homology domain-containing protein [Syntrophomonas sp.]
MIRKFNSPLLILLSIISLCCSTLFFPAVAEAAVDLDTMAIKAVQYNYSSYQQGQALDGYDAWVLGKTCAQVSNWIYDGSDLKTTLLSSADQILADPDKKIIDSFGNPAYSYSSKQIAQLNLLARSWGEDEKASALLSILQNRQQTAINASIDNNPFGDISAFEYLGLSGDLPSMNTAGAIDYIIQNSDPGTGAWTSSWNDVMATNQAIRSLKYLEVLVPERSNDINAAIAQGLIWLQSLQKADGSFQDAGGFDDPLIDSIEVVLTLKALDINPASWSSLEGKTALDYLQEKALNPDGSLGTSKNKTDAIWALNACLNLGVQIPLETPLGLHITPPTASIEKNGTQAFHAVLKLMNTDQDLSDTAKWSVADKTIASISKGSVQGLSEGQTKITASSNGFDASATLTVRPRSGGGESSSSNTTVSIAVVSKDGSLLYGPSSICLSSQDRFGLTAMGALNKTGLIWGFSEQWEGLIVKIAGEQNQGMSGWMYSVNSRVPGVLACEQSVSNGDRIIFWYSQDASASSPEWDCLGSGQNSNPEVKEKPVEEAKVLPEIKPELDKQAPTPPARVSFNDVDDNLAWARDAIELLAGRGIIQGRGEHFDPLAPVTRAEFISLIARALGNNSSEYQGIMPKDVSVSDWFYPALQYCLQEGIISGYPDGSFRAGNAISRQEMACIFYRLQKDSSQYLSVVSGFIDQDTIAPWAVSAVKLAVAGKLMQGYEDGSFRAGQPCSRAEAAVILFRYLNSMETAPLK